MEVFLHNLPPQATETDVRRHLEPILRANGIQVFRCSRLKKAGCANLTLLSREEGLKVIQVLGKGLEYQSKIVQFTPSRYEPNEWLLKSMEKDLKDRLKTTSRQGSVGHTTPQAAEFAVESLACGLWDYKRDELVFVSYFENRTPGTFGFGKHKLEIHLKKPNAGTPAPQMRLDIPHDAIQSITIGNKQCPSLTLSLTEAPRMYIAIEDYADPVASTEIEQMLASLGIVQNKKELGGKKQNWRRVCHLGKNHQQVVATCLVYRVILQNSRDLQRITALEKRRGRELPPMVSWPVQTSKPAAPFHEEVSALNQHLAACTTFPFGLNFQLQKLNQNGCLPPSKVMALLPEVKKLVQRSGAETAAEVIRKLTTRIGFPGPDTPAADMDQDGLVGLIRESERLIERTSTISTQQSNQKLCLIYKAVVTPTGVYLYGPDFEVGNRVLRQYSNSASQFLRVSFLDENVEPVRFDADASNEEVFSRFRTKLKESINIAGRDFKFLGYSHSSLRSQTCWYMAPHVHRGSLLISKILIAKIGDFSAIRCPAKCAARIGQAFSDTTAAVKIAKSAVRMIPDIQRLGRVFSDGVGTVSRAIVERILMEYPRHHHLIPTAFQIRFKGAKGMISFDSTLKGEVLCLRPSMVKFEGRDAGEIEICGMASGPLPLYLNRQLIKILEDLSVPHESFQRLQDNAVQLLRKCTSSGLNAARFFKRVTSGGGARLPSLLSALHSMGIPFQADGFLREVVELGVLMALKDIKHKSRILVPDGVTLFGVVDETGFLGEGEIYCCIKERGSDNQVLRGRMACTRSPALHPGDIQMVTAVSVPRESPLTDLYNVVVFNSKGSRDMASQLSGGDLDGDLFQVIYDKSLCPRKIAEPADYPRVSPRDIGRPVTVADMAEFFLEFMENDQLGRIAILHQVFADQAPRGTFDDRCLKLADMHSTAVDFSKTGIPVDISQLPRLKNRCRPDFLTPGAHVTVDKGLRIEDLDDSEPAESSTGYTYYDSPKTLGHLYRSIDEQSFFQDLQNASTEYRKANSGSLLQTVWLRLRRDAPAVDWKPYITWAEDVKESYESNLLDAMADYSASFSRPLDELEAFLGTIIGMRSVPTRRQKEASVELKERMERDIAFTTEWMANGPGGTDVNHLGQAMACMSLGLVVRPEDRLRSFAWVAAGICLKEVAKLRA